MVAPQLPVRGDLWAEYADAVGETVQDVQAVPDGDRARTFLTGFSFGGDGVFQLALVQAEFSARRPAHPDDGAR